MRMTSPQHWEPAALELLMAHCESLDPDAPSARARLNDALGPELAGKLVFALSAHAPRQVRDNDLRPRFVFAA